MGISSTYYIIFGNLMKRSKRYAVRLLLLTKKLPSRQKMIVLSIIIGFIVGLLAVLMKFLVFTIIEMLTGGFAADKDNYWYLIYPAIGIMATVLFIKYLLRKPVRDGIPNVLHAISKKHGIIKSHNTFSSIITSALTVGFGGSVGLEGPTVVTGVAFGSRIAKALGLNYKQTVSVLGFASAAAMSAIFKAPIAAIVFALEVILFDMTMTALVPILLASITAALTSYFFLGLNVLYPFEVVDAFNLNETPYYLGLGVFTALVSAYFIKIYVYSGKVFERIHGWVWKFLIGVSALGLLIFMLPALYGEGYESVNGALKGSMDFVFDNSVFYGMRESIPMALLLLTLIILFKAIATSLTFRAGGVGGIFAPTLFIGTMSGLLFVKVINYYGLAALPESNFALVGMAGLLAGVVHAPLTAIFLIAEITGGYDLFLPIMMVSTVSYAFSRLLTSSSIYTIQLTKRGDMLTHNKDLAMLSLMHIEDLIENNFSTIHSGASLRELVKVISSSNRNIFPVVDEDMSFHGIIFLDQIRHIMFNPEIYDSTMVENLMYMPSQLVEIDDDMETVATKFQHSGKYNLVVLENGKYKGFVSRANVFSHYRDMLKDFSED